MSSESSKRGWECERRYRRTEEPDTINRNEEKGLTALEK
jgi:hypothetical protein